MVFIAGASGFVGGHLVADLIAKGQTVKCLARSEKTRQSLSEKGVVVIPGDITQPDSLKDVLQPDDFVVHLVGIIEEKGKATFQSVHVEGTAHLVTEARRAGVRHFFYQSALGADISSWSGYLRTKAEAEEIVRKSGLRHTIFRPSLIVGPWDGFTKKMADMIKLSPILPIPGEGKAKFQPLYIKDWLRCMLAVIENPERYSATFDIGGPEHLSYREIVDMLAKALGREKISVTVPMGLMKIGASLLQAVLPSPPVTSDQLRLLEQDNTADPGAVEKLFGFVPKRFEDALREFI